MSPADLPPRRIQDITAAAAAGLYSTAGQTYYITATGAVLRWTGDAMADTGMVAELVAQIPRQRSGALGAG